MEVPASTSYSNCELELSSPLSSTTLVCLRHHDLPQRWYATTTTTGDNTAAAAAGPIRHPSPYPRLRVQKSPAGVRTQHTDVWRGTIWTMQLLYGHEQRLYNLTRMRPEVFNKLL